MMNGQSEEELEGNSHFKLERLKSLAVTKKVADSCVQPT